MQIFFDHPVTYVVEEFYVFDRLSLLGEVGGAIGLFLGWSCWGAISQMLNGAASMAGTSKGSRKRKKARRTRGSKF